MNLHDAQQIAEEIKAQLAPHCERLEIAGSIRRKKPEVKDIEIVAIPKPYDTGLFENGLAEVVNAWEKVRGELEFYGRPGVKPCRYTQRIHPAGIKLDLFFAKPSNWGLILALRTGSSEFNQAVLLPAAAKLGYRVLGGHLRYNGSVQPTPEETLLFKLLDIPFCPPEDRSL